MPITRLKVRIITQDSPRVSGADDVATRLRQLDHAFTTAEALRPILPIPRGPNNIPLPPPPPQDVLNIYMAPEYFFRKSINNSKIAKIGTAYTEHEKDVIKAALVRRSKQGPGGCLVIAGSIFWVVARTGGWEVRNTAYVLYNGAELLEYDKRFDCCELETFENVHTGGTYAFRPGVQQGTFTVAGLNCGLETCVDHQMAQLARRDNLTSLDLQFVVSNITTIDKRAIAVHPRGYVLQSNAGSMGARVFQNPFTFTDEGDIDGPQRGADPPVRHAFFDLPFPAVPVASRAAAKLKVVG